SAAKHAAAQRLFGVAERFRDQAELFCPEFVMEGHAVGQSLAALTEQGMVAAEALCKLEPDWELVLLVSTGLQTLEQLRKSLQWRDAAEGPKQTIPSTTRAAERRVPPISDWTTDTIEAALGDIGEL